MHLHGRDWTRVEIKEQDSLVIAVVSREEVDSRRWLHSNRAIDVVRLHESETLDKAERSELGFLNRPRYINWWSSLRDCEDDFVAGLTATERRNIRLGLKAIQEESLRVEVRVGLTEEVLDNFLVVYDEQISGMVHGKNYARRFRDEILSSGKEYVSACAYSGSYMVVGSIWWMRPQESMLQMRFSASRPDARSSRVMRTVYMEAFRFARESGYSYGSLGNDPSLFGHLVQPGLFNFKSRLGFTPIPAGALSSQFAGVFIEKIVSMRSLSDPSLLAVMSEDGVDTSWPEVIERKSLDLIFLLSDSTDESVVRNFRTDGFKHARLLKIS